MTIAANASKEDRVRAHTKPELNEKIDTEIERRIRFYAAQDAHAIGERLEELDREWDIERVLEANAASLILLGVLLGATTGRKWLIVPLAVSGFLLRHAIEGWCPPVPLLRKLGVRTRSEIERERQALKFLRGDFEGLERDERGAFRDPEKIREALRR
jgi:hypothetical protein